RYKAEVDLLLAERAGDTLKKIPAIYDRLAAGQADGEAISQALTSCRRMIDSFADAVHPPSDVPAVIDGETLELKRSRVLNRINEHVRQHTASATRRERIKKTLEQIYARVSAGVHRDVTEGEARALFLLTYTVLGELIQLVPLPTLAAAALPAGTVDRLAEIEPGSAVGDPSADRVAPCIDRRGIAAQRGSRGQSVRQRMPSYTSH
ncbi:MAG TPA: hypothetical protein VG370_03100, partial [Chloroflexota bacterium]|nr:hypothetical protein [Chloroflexota bacterium]